jgi:transcriptional regulator with XRE-family HTH domain
MVQECFGEFIKKARKRSGLTQEQLAEGMTLLCGIEVQQQTISNWERSVNAPLDRLTFLNLARALAHFRGFDDLEDVNRMLAIAGQGALHEFEVEQFFRSLPASTAEQGSNGSRNGDAGGAKHEGARPQQPESGARGGEGSGGNAGGLTAPPGNSPASHPWYRRVIGGASRLREVLEKPPIYGMLAALLLATATVCATWVSPAAWTAPHQLVLIIIGLWTTTLLLIVPPRDLEQLDDDGPWKRLKLFRLSGAACGVTVLVGVLLLVEATLRLLFGNAPTTPVYLVLAPFLLAFAYAGGLDVQYWFNRRQGQHEVFSPRSALYVSLLMLAAQALVVLSLFLMYMQVGDLLWILLLLTAPGLMLWAAIRNSRRVEVPS